MSVKKNVLVTGGCGFIGSELIRQLIALENYKVVNVDKLTYAGNIKNVSSVADSPDYSLELADICDKDKMGSILENYQPDIIINLAAESHVDRSIDQGDRMNAH